MSTLSNIQNLLPVGTVLNATRNSSPCSLQKLYNFAIQIVFTGTPTGSFKLQASCDPFPNGPFGNGPTNWTDVASSTFSVSAAGSVMWDYSMTGFNWVRFVYTDASGGASTAIVTVSSFNGK